MIGAATFLRAAMVIGSLALPMGLAMAASESALTKSGRQ
jgi:hypothetical protein